jgi:thioesterase domain-containing protein
MMALPGRFLSHVKSFLIADARCRSEYIHARVENTKRRVLEWFGQAHELIDDIPFADEEMNQRMRKLWAHYWQARNRYRPKGVEPCELLLVRTEIAEEWIGTKAVDALYGWGQFVSGETSVVMIPGVHLMLFEASNQGKIAKAIAERITRHANSIR